jgi:AraC family transcriptional regulator, regulatory protein of adaptative response / DNA-3-methyladenine glycosylase II
MLSDREACYQVILSQDERFDGFIFVGVSTTGIYCRPICSARKPRVENCIFFSNAASAERAGFRPCLRCRPELAPGNTLCQIAGNLAPDIIRRIEDGALNELNVTQLAAEFHISERHLHRIVKGEMGVSPLELAQTYRLLTAKRLLTDTNLPVTEIAFASGFSSIRRFNGLFKTRYRINPTDLRKSNQPLSPANALTFELAYLPPYNWPKLLRFFSRWGCPGVETTRDGLYFRTARINNHAGWISIANNAHKHVIQIHISPSLAVEVTAILAAIKRMFDLPANPQVIYKRLGQLAHWDEGIRIPGTFNLFEAAIHTILSQQVTQASAKSMMSRFVQAFGEPINSPVEELHLLFPKPETVRSQPVEKISQMGITQQKSLTIWKISENISNGSISDPHRMNMEDWVNQLQIIPGIGPWSAQLIALRAFSWPDAFPHTDLGLRKASGIQNARNLLKVAEAWRPWRAYAAMHLWESIINKTNWELE